MSLLRKLLTISFVVLLHVGVEARSVTITRNSFGVPTITGGDLAEVSRAIGYVHAEDRLWQIFLQNIVANGRAAQYLGPGTGDELIESDIFQRQINPTDEEVEREIRTLFTENAIIAFKNYVKGLNDYVDEVNDNIAIRPLELLEVLGTDPIPHFTLFDNLRSVRLFLQSFSPTQIPQFQLTNIVALQTLAAIFGSTDGYSIFQDIDPTTSQVRSLVTVMQNRNATPKAALVQPKDYYLPLNDESICNISSIAGKIKHIKDLHKKMTPGLGSNGQVIGPKKSASGNPLLRCAIQPNFNHPSDFYQVIIEKSFFSGNFFIVPGIPFGIGMYNRFGFTVQTGHLPTNDFLFEPTTNVISSRPEVIKVAGSSDIPIIVYRSSSGGWVIENPVMPDTMLTLRCAYIHRQLQGLNIIGDLPFINSVPEFFKKVLKFDQCSDLIGFEGQCADCDGNYGAFQATDWTQLPSEFDRRLPQGVILFAPPNSTYDLSASGRLPMYDINNEKGYYSGWDNPFKQFADGSADTTTGISLSRAYWLVEYLNSFKKISYDDLKRLTFHQAVANSIVAFEDSKPTADADLFTPLFKRRFFEAVYNNSPTTDQLEALEFLRDFDGRWFYGDESEVVTTTNVSDKFILASAWLLNVAAEILNPTIGLTSFEVEPGSSGVVNSLPTLNAAGASNNLATYQGNLLARILGTSSDNTLLYDGWLDTIPNVDAVISNALTTAINNLGGFGARPWGAGLRPIYYFNNAILGPVAEALIFNSSGLYFVTEFGPKGITRIESTLPLGESGQVLVGPTFNPHNFDQLPYYSSFQLIPD